MARRSRIVLAALLATALTGSPVRAGVNEWTSIGPVPLVTSVAAVGSPTVLYAGTDRDIFRSNDGGSTWDTSPAPIGPVTFWAFTPADPLRIFVGGFGSVAGSDDGGVRWHTALVPEWHGITGLAVDPVTPDTVYVSTGTEALYRSVNGGFDYAPWGNDMFPLFRGKILVDPTLPTRLYMQAGEGPYRSDDGGEHWSPLPLPTIGLTPLALDPARPTTVYGCGGDPIVPTTHRSDDAGTTWEDRGGPCPAIISDMFVAAGDPERLWGGWTHVFTSRDAGGHWYEIARGLAEDDLGWDSFLASDPNDARRLYVATRHGGVMVYDDRCGNGTIDANETCDDGNGVDGDGCRPDCSIEIHGDDRVDPDEECDDGNQVNGDGCDANFTRTGCGNGIVTDGEACDDGNDVVDDGCGHCQVRCLSDGDCDTGDPCLVGVCSGGFCGAQFPTGDAATLCRVHETVGSAACIDTLASSLSNRVRDAVGALAAAVPGPLSADSRRRLARTFRRLARQVARDDRTSGRCARTLRRELLIAANDLRDR